MGKRELGQLGIMDLIVYILIAELAALSIGDTSIPILYSIVPICFVVIFQVLAAYISLKNSTFRYLIEGKPSVIINKGKLNFREMVKQRYNLDDLMLQLREHSIKNIEEVEFAILENNGKLSTFIYPKVKGKSTIPLPLILDGEIQMEALEMLDKNKQWLDNILNERGIDIENVFYAFYKGDKTFIIKKDDNQ
jgi:uncharacterized membrane protein YcaP (DUF421 family)